MQVNVIDGGNLAARALLYRQPTEQIMNYINSGLDRLRSYGSALSDGFMNAINNVYNQYWSDGVLEASKWLLNSTGNNVNHEVIYNVPYESFGNNINLLMQRYIMAQPDLNELYRRNMCHGFQETYLNTEPGVFGTERQDYQRVMDGVLQFDKEGNGYVVHYSNSDNIELDFVDKLSVLGTWDVIGRLIAEGKDPSDPLLGDL